MEYFWQGTEPKELDPQPREAWINQTTGLPIKEGDSQDNLVLQKHYLLSDPFTKDYCVDCTRALDDKGQPVYEQYIVDMQKYYAGYDERTTTPKLPNAPQ
jgi:hypothetical protein